MTTQPTRGYPLRLDDVAALIPHSGLCDVSRTLVAGRAAGLATTAPAGGQCTCGAGLLRLMAGGR